MKVVCMTHENFSGIAIINDPHPSIGEIVTVVGEGIHCGVEVYYFEEYNAPLLSSEIWGYDKRNYSPISDIDERELVNIKEKCDGVNNILY